MHYVVSIISPPASGNSPSTERRICRCTCQTLPPKILFQTALPILVSHEYLSELWIPTSHCCVFFLFQRTDKFIYDQLCIIQQRVLSGELTTWEGSINRINMLYDVIKDNQNNDFIKSIQTNFCEGFFEKVGIWLHCLYPERFFQQNRTSAVSLTC